MKRSIPLTREEILARLDVDLDTGIAVWIDATKYHRNLVGKLAGQPVPNHIGKIYWVIRINRRAYKRSQIILFLKTGIWPTEMVDHRNGNSLDDRAENLRHATGTQNAWNHQKRRKRSPLPMGVRALPGSGRYQARIACHKKMHHLGAFDTVDEAHQAYLVKRKELFGEFA